MIPGIDEEDATNALYAFRDYSSEHLMTVGEVEEGEMSLKEDDPNFKYLDKATNKIKTFYLDFRNIRQSYEKKEEPEKKGFIHLNIF